MFLTNMGSHIFFCLLSAMGFLACVFLSMRWNYFRGLRSSYIFCGIISTVQACFIDTLLTGFIQLKYVCPS